MTTLKKGDLITNLYGGERKVMEVCGTILHISYSYAFNYFCFTSTEAQLKADGYTWDTPAWEPNAFQLYWFIDEMCRILDCEWEDDEVDRQRRDFLGIYQTKELAEAALLEIRRKLGK